MTYYTIRGIVGRGFPILVITSFIGLITGQILNYRLDQLVFMPIILLLIPSLIKIGGDTGSMLGARISSALHMGLGGHITKNPIVRNSVLAALIVGLTASAILSFIVWITGHLMGIGISLFVLFKICMIAGSIELIVVFFMTILISFISHRFGLDPDDTVIPIIATLGDLVGVAGIFITLHMFSML
ncbi:magnesium transporter [Methanomethylovorans sp.]|uniref:magnesium transporter n=1 Tax=Methanomethylovorans sp. TaxID=2758717 RepID=UPI001BD45E90|nr:magnesium transporter [Methanomethylovorans sp.]